jgi:hypothetical protein
MSENQKVGRGETLADDLIYGAEEIGDFLGITARAAYHQIESGNLPVKRMGRLIVASKSALRRAFGAEA